MNGKKEGGDSRIYNAKSPNTTTMVICATFVGLILLLQLGASRDPVQGTIEAEGFVLHNADGQAVAALELHDDGLPGFALMDKNGRTRAVLSIDKNDSTAFTFLDAKKKRRLALYVNKEGEPSVQLADDAERQRLEMHVAADGTAALGLLDKESKPRLGIGTDGNGASLRAVGLDGKSRLVVGVTPEGDAVFQKFDKDGRPIE